MKILILIGAFLSLQFVNAQQKEINWIDFEELDAALETEIKPVVIYFYTDWCAYCKKMDRNAFRDSEVVSTLNQNFYAVKMNAESTENIEFEGQVFKNEQAAHQRNGIHQIPLILASRENKPISFPVVMVLDKDFKVKKKSYEYLTSENMKTLIKG